MNQKICPNCRASNTPEMSFCSNCGQGLAASNQSNFSSDLPPTIFGGSPVVPNFAPNAPNFSPQIANRQATAPKKSRMGMWLAILGGLAFLFIIGGSIALGALYYLISSNNSATSSDYNSSISNSNLGIRTVDSTANSSTSNSVSNSGSAVLSTIQTRKQVGAFSQVSAKYVTPSEYFPKATDAAQALYQNGSQGVVLTVGKFPSGKTAKAALKIQLNGVKSENGTISFSNLNKLVFDSATYNYKGYTFYEECNDKGLCTRMHSKEDAALAEFMKSYNK